MFKIDAKRPCFKLERWAELYYMHNKCSDVERNIVYTFVSQKTNRVISKFQIDVQYSKNYMLKPSLRAIKKTVPVEVKNRNIRIDDVVIFYKKMRMLNAFEGEMLTSRKIYSDAYSFAREKNIAVKGAVALGKTRLYAGRTIEEQVRNICPDYSTAEKNVVVRV